MKSRMMLSILVIAMVAAVIGGATMAYFFFKVEVENEFTAGTVRITAEEDAEVTGDLDNVNPGDCYDKRIDIEVTGSKGVVLRVKNAGEWVYTDAWRDYLFTNWEALCYSGEEKPALGDRDAWDAIISAMNATENLVDFSLLGWLGPDDDGWYYSPKGYEAGAEFGFDVTVCFDGPLMDNRWQKATFNMVTKIEALQSSNYAPYHHWGVDYYGTPSD